MGTSTEKLAIIGKMVKAVKFGDRKAVKYITFGPWNGKSEGFFRDINTKRHWESHCTACEDKGTSACQLTLFTSCAILNYTVSHSLIPTCIEIELKQKNDPNYISKFVGVHNEI